MKIVTLALVAAFTGLAAATAFAADTPAAPPMGDKPHGDHMKERMKEIDTNNDTAISKDEWRAKGDKMFNEMDADHDGKITPEEMKTHREAKRAEWLKKHPRVGTAAAEKLEKEGAK